MGHYMKRYVLAPCTGPYMAALFLRYTTVKRYLTCSRPLHEANSLLLEFWPVWAPEQLPSEPSTMPTHTCPYVSPTIWVRQKSNGSAYVGSKNRRFYTAMHCANRRCARISLRTCRFGVDDRFHESPSPCPRAPVGSCSRQGPSSDRATVVYIRGCNTPPVAYQACMY